MKSIVTEKSGRIRVQTVNKEPSLTQQQFKDECDINNIVKRYNQTGEFLHLTSKQGRFADFSDITDYQTMLDTVARAQEAFASLPANVRTKFSNDPGRLLEFIQDKNNYAEGVELGLLTPKPPTPTSQKAPTSKNESNDKTEGAKP